MKRRTFIAALGGAAAWPAMGWGRQPAMPVIGLLSGTQAEDRQISAIRQGLKEGGYTEGRNVAIKYRSADGHFDRLPGLAAELVADPVDVIVAVLSPTTVAAAKAAAPNIPIVFALGADPVDLGLVSSLNRPGANITGVVLSTHLEQNGWSCCVNLSRTRLLSASSSIRRTLLLNSRARTFRQRRESSTLSSQS